jgi:hypothetical protein
MSKKSDEASHVVLGGATRIRTRKRGFAPWKPQQDTQRLLGLVRGVLHEYRYNLPLTVRQIFYRLVGAHGYDKTEAAYYRLVEHLNSARRARIIPMSAIRDDGNTALAPVCYRDASDFLGSVRSWADDMELDHSAGQRVRLVVFCEAAGMAPQLARVANPFGVPVYSGGGFDSLTAKHDFASELADHDRPTEVLHIGDHDPSGAHMFLAFAEDVAAFARDLGGNVTFTRLAVTPRQIERFNLPTDPSKPTDKRAFRGPTCQAEALAPDDLAAIVRDAIMQRFDQAVLDRVLKREKRERAKLRKWLGAMRTR